MSVSYFVYFPNKCNSFLHVIEIVIRFPISPVVSSQSFLFHDWIPIIVKLGPFEKGTTLFVWYIASMAHPEIFSKILLLSLNHSQHTWYFAFALWRQVWVQAGSVVPIRDVDPPVARYRMRVNGLCRCDAVLPFLLHLSVHHKK